MSTAGLNIGDATVDTAAIGSVTDQTTDTTQDVTVDTTDSQQTTDDSTQDVDQTTDDQQTDDQTQVVAGPERFKDVIEGLKKTNPALAKELKTLVFAQDAFRKEFPGGLNEIRQLKTTVDDLGGAEGIESLKAEKQEWAQIDDQFKEGNPAVLETFAKFNPEGFAKLVPGAIDMLAKTDKAAYDHAMSGIFVSTLDSWKFTDTIERIFDDLSQYKDAQGNFQFAGPMQRLQNLFKSYQSIQELAKNAPKRTADTEDKKVREQREEIAKERAAVVSERVTSATKAYAEPKVTSFLTVEAKNQKLNLESLKGTQLGEGATAYTRVLSEIDEEIARMIVADKPTLQKIGDSIAAGRRDEAIKLSNSKFDQVYQAAVKKVVKLWTVRSGVGEKPKANGAAGTDGKPVTTPGVKRLDSRPDLGLVDQTKAGWRENFMQGKATLKTGQKVEW